MLYKSLMRSLHCCLSENWTCAMSHEYRKSANHFHCPACSPRESLIITEETLDWFPLNHGFWKQPHTSWTLAKDVIRPGTSLSPSCTNYTSLSPATVAAKPCWANTEQTMKVVVQYAMLKLMRQECQEHLGVPMRSQLYHKKTKQKHFVLQRKLCYWGVELISYKWECNVFFRSTAIFFVFDYERWLKPYERAHLIASVEHDTLMDWDRCTISSAWNLINAALTNLYALDKKWQKNKVIISFKKKHYIIEYFEFLPSPYSMWVEKTSAFWKVS